MIDILDVWLLWVSNAPKFKAIHVGIKSMEKLPEFVSWTWPEFAVDFPRNVCPKLWAYPNFGGVKQWNYHFADCPSMRGTSFERTCNMLLLHLPKISDGPPGAHFPCWTISFSKPKRPGRLGSWMRRDHAKTDLAVRNFALPFAVGITCQLGDGNIIRSMVLGPNQATEKISRYEMSQRASAETAREFVHIQRWQCAIQSCWHCHGFTRESIESFFVCYFTTSGYFFIRRQRCLTWKTCFPSLELCWLASNMAEASGRIFPIKILKWNQLISYNISDKIWKLQKTNSFRI